MKQPCDGQDLLIWDEDYTNMYFNIIIHSLTEVKILLW